MSAPPPLPVTESPQTSVLDRALIRGLAWTGSVKWGSQLIAWLATLFVAHVLMRADYAILTMSAVFMALVHCSAYWASAPCSCYCVLLPNNTTLNRTRR